MEQPNELLIIFESLIQKYGGRSVLLRQIECEIQHIPIGKARYKWTHEATNFLIEHYNSKTTTRIAQILNITHDIVAHKIESLKVEKMLLARRKPRMCTGYSRNQINC